MCFQDMTINAGQSQINAARCNCTFISGNGIARFQVNMIPVMTIRVMTLS